MKAENSFKLVAMQKYHLWGEKKTKTKKRIGLFL